MSDQTRKRKSESVDETPLKSNTSSETDGVRHGSYHQYYEFRSEDSRPKYIEKCLPELLKLIDKHQEGKDIYLLDVGCNSGKLTRELFEKLKNVCPEQQIQVLGVDIDQELVEKATADHGSQFLEFAHADISEVSSSKETNQIERYMLKKDIKRFDFLCCFSVLMYIHLNHGDDGLMRVLDYVCSHTELLVLELQGWKKYRDHARRMRKLGAGEYDHYSQLTWKGSNGFLEEQISDYVVSRGFTVISNTEEKNEFNRDVVIYARNKS
ncbi:AAEL006515-PA [Aedes aegypti]|nr:AAEL006515-PA [Aedes aegypti]